LARIEKTWKTKETKTLDFKPLTITKENSVWSSSFSRKRLEKSSRSISASAELAAKSAERISALLRTRKPHGNRRFTDFKHLHPKQTKYLKLQKLRKF
jgi:hypothetical protein